MIAEYAQSEPIRSKYADWDEAARAVVCDNCGANWLYHYQRRPVSYQACYLGWRADAHREIIEHKINGAVVYSDQFGRVINPATLNVKQGWGPTIKQLMMEEEAQP